jgi:hypothetical protein
LDRLTPARKTVARHYPYPQRGGAVPAGAGVPAEQSAQRFIRKAFVLCRRGK